MEPDSPRERLFPDFNPLGSLIQGADLCSSSVTKSGLAAGGSVGEIESHTITGLTEHIAHHKLDLALSYTEMTVLSLVKAS